MALPRFSLLTLLAMTTIAAWVLACRPYVVTRFGKPDESIVLGGYVASTVMTYRCPNPQLLWPAAALVTFVGWKMFGSIRQQCVKASVPTSS